MSASDSKDPQPRNLVLCFDGTGNQYGEANTNVIKFFGLLDKRSPLEQIVYYQPGIGTFINPGVVDRSLTWIALKVDEGFAWYIHEHIMEGYRFLMGNYREGDKICLFGFSRGAYTARALAGFLDKIGLLPKDNDQQVTFAYNLYKRRDEAGKHLAGGFKGTFCTPVTIEFLGVWDTVASVGLLYDRALPFTARNPAVKIARHALALDERRARFQPSRFVHKTPGNPPEHKERDPSGISPNHESGEAVEPRPYPKFGFKRWVKRHSPKKRIIEVLEKDENEPPGSPPVEISRSPSHPIPPVLEVWFAGCHSDVGGGAVKDDVQYSLTEIPLRWMVKQVILADCGIKFNHEALERAGIDVSTIRVLSRTPSSEREESKPEGETLLQVLRAAPSSQVEADEVEEIEVVKELAWPREQDIVGYIHDEIKRKPGWWLLEALPAKFTWRDPDGSPKSKWKSNWGFGRQIRDERPNFHSTVREKMDNSELNYQPNALWERGSENYVN